MLRSCKDKRPGPSQPPAKSLEALKKTNPLGDSGAIKVMGNACDEYRTLSESNNLCYEFHVPKIVGMLAEDAVLLP